MSVGYAYLKMDIPAAGRVSPNGLDFNARMDFKPRWGLAIDTSYARTSKVLTTPHDGYILSFLGGPVFYPGSYHNTRMFVHFLAGMSVVDGAVPATATTYTYGWLSRPAFAIGGGAEHPITGHLGLRLTGDYLHTTFFDSSAAMQPQNNLRLTAGLVFHIRDLQHRPVIH